MSNVRYPTSSPLYLHSLSPLPLLGLSHMLTLLDLSYPNNTLSHLTSNIHNLYLHYLHFSLSLCLSSRSLIIILSSKNLGISIGRGSISLTLSASLDSRSPFLSKIFPGRSHSPTLHGLCLPLFLPPFLYLLLLLLCQCDWPLI